MRSPLHVLVIPRKVVSLHTEQTGQRTLMVVGKRCLIVLLVELILVQAIILQLKCGLIGLVPLLVIIPFLN